MTKEELLKRVAELEKENEALQKELERLREILWNWGIEFEKGMKH